MLNSIDSVSENDGMHEFDLDGDGNDGDDGDNINDYKMQSRSVGTTRDLVHLTSNYALLVQLVEDLELVSESKVFVRLYKMFLVMITNFKLL